MPGCHGKRAVDDIGFLQPPSKAASAHTVKAQQGFPPAMAEERITLVKPAQRKPTASQTPGMFREEAFASKDVWAGYVRSTPKSPSAWHHHGDHESYIFVLEGKMRFEFGPGGKEAVEAEPGDFVRVPRNTVHRENNPSSTEGRFVVLRFGSGPPNFNVEGPSKT